MPQTGEALGSLCSRQARSKQKHLQNLDHTDTRPCNKQWSQIPLLGSSSGRLLFTIPLKPFKIRSVLMNPGEFQLRVLMVLGSGSNMEEDKQEDGLIVVRGLVLE